MFNSRMLRVFGLLAAMPGMAQADLPELFGNLQIPSTLPLMVEDSADLIIQVPRHVDPDSPVPLRIRVLQSPVSAITLLSDAVDPVQLASFQLQPGVNSQLSTRFMSSGVDGVLVVVRTATDRIFAGRRTFEVFPGADSPVQDEAESESSALEVADSELPDEVASGSDEAMSGSDEAVAEADKTVSASVKTAPDLDEVQPDEVPPVELRLEAVVNGDSTRVTLRSAEPLVKRMQHQVLSVPENPVQRFELKHNGRLLVTADLAPAMWSDPFFRFGFAGGKQGDRLTLTWVRADGEQGELQAKLEPAG